jgi:hypothetical protein
MEERISRDCMLLMILLLILYRMLVLMLVLMLALVLGLAPQIGLAPPTAPPNAPPTAPPNAPPTAPPTAPPYEATDEDAEVPLAPEASETGAEIVTESAEAPKVLGADEVKEVKDNMRW